MKKSRKVNQTKGLVKMSQSLVEINLEKLLKKNLDSSSEDLQSLSYDKTSESSDVEVISVEITNNDILLKENRPLTVNKNCPEPEANPNLANNNPTKGKRKALLNNKAKDSSDLKVKKIILQKDSMSSTVNNNSIESNLTINLTNASPLKEKLKRKNDSINLRVMRHPKKVNDLSTSAANDNQKNVTLKNLTGQRDEIKKSITDDSSQSSHLVRKGPILSIEFIKENNKAIEYYTGLQNFEKFLLVFQTLGSDVYSLQYYYSDEPIPVTHLDQFFMTLILLKLQKSHYEISILFDVSLKDIKNIFITWVKFMSMEWCGLKFPNLKITFKSKESQDDQKQKQKENSQEEHSEASDDIRVINWGKLSNDDKSCFKKVYKVLNEPKNYMEKILMNEIVVVCHTLCFFKTRRMIDLKKYIKRANVS